MRKILFLVSISIFTIHSSPQIFTVTDTVTLRSTIFENNTEDYVIKNYGVLLLESCTFRNNILGSKTSDAIYSSDNIVAPIINYGKLSLSNCEFIDNYSWNTALTADMEAQIAAGAIANFGELNMSGTTFKDNSYQKGYFTIIDNAYVNRFSYIGDDAIYNKGAIETINSSETSDLDNDFLFDAGVVENPVRNKAGIVVKTNARVSVEINISDALENSVFSLSDNINATKIFTWNLKNQSGKKVAPGTYLLRVVAFNDSGKAASKSIMLGVGY
jgi:hypothetical protein